jgi:hypothetical protein
MVDITIARSDAHSCDYLIVAKQTIARIGKRVVSLVERKVVSRVGKTAVSWAETRVVMRDAWKRSMCGIHRRLAQKLRAGLHAGSRGRLTGGSLKG